MRQERRLPTPLRPRRPGSGSGPMARRRAIQASEPAPGDDFDPVSHNTAALLAQCEDLDNPLHVEVVISRFLPCWGDHPPGFNVDYVNSTTFEIIDELEINGTETALVVLRGLEAVAGGAIAQEAAAATKRLATKGVAAPPWARQIGQAQAVDARITRHDEDDSVGVLIEYAYPDGERHTLATFIAGYMDGAVKFMGLMQPIEHACRGDDDELRFAPLAPGVARQRVCEALEATDQLHARFDGDPSMREFGALAWSRVRS